MKVLFVIAGLMLTSPSLLAADDTIGQSCARLAAAPAVCSAEKTAKIQSSSRDEYRACMKGFVRDCREEFAKP
ncbi:MAG: hypothetical protein HYW49_13855 [Deltaproteobacteria bacterium]|nr:hypothetical protein [Deltaproteobacteria bacterium]